MAELDQKALAEKDPADMSLEELQAEEARLRVEDLRLTVGTRRARIQQRQIEINAREESVNDAVKRIESEQHICKHKTGGKDRGGILNGSGQIMGYCVVQNTYPNGDTVVHCFRCNKQYFKPGCKMQELSDPRGFMAQRASKKVYAQQLTEWKEAMDWPSANTPSGQQTHLITQNAPSRPPRKRSKAKGAAA